MNPDYLLVVLSCTSALLVVITVRVYDRILRDVIAERDALHADRDNLIVQREELLADNDLFSDLLSEALGRHPAKGAPLRRIK